MDLPLGVLNETTPAGSIQPPRRMIQANGQSGTLLCDRVTVCALNHRHFGIGRAKGNSRDPVNRDLLLLEIPPVLLVNQHQVQVIPRRKLLVDVAERRRELEPAEEEPDRYRLAPHRRAVHDLKLGDGLGLVVQVGRGARRFPPHDRELDVFDLDPDEEEVDFANDDVFQVVPGCQLAALSAC